MLLLKLLIQMTLASPTLLSIVYKKSINAAVTCKRMTENFGANFIMELLAWTFFVLGPLILLALNCGAHVLQSCLFVPKYAWDLFWHEDGRSILDML